MDDATLAKRRATNTKILKWFGGALALLIVLVGCGALLGDDESPEAKSPEPTSEPTAEPEPTVEPEPEPEPVGIDAEAIHATFLEANGRPIKDMCDAAWTHWACFFDKVEAFTDDGLRVHLTTDGGWSDADLDEMAERAGDHWFNFVGREHEDLDMVNVWVNGLDRKTLYRRDNFMLNKD